MYPHFTLTTFGKPLKVKINTNITSNQVAWQSANRKQISIKITAWFPQKFIIHSFPEEFTSSNCSYGAAISSTDTAHQTVHACDMPIGRTCTDTETHCTMDMRHYQTPICPKTHHTSLNPPSSDPISLSGQPTRFSTRCTPS